jgi:DNA-binding transcriptional regulator YiaG
MTAPYREKALDRRVDFTPQDLKDFRKDTGKTQPQLAAILGYSVETVKKVEAGRMEISRSLAQVYGYVMRDWLYFGHTVT